jgi:hypothetical protein
MNNVITKSAPDAYQVIFYLCLCLVFCMPSSKKLTDVIQFIYSVELNLTFNTIEELIWCMLQHINFLLLLVLFNVWE